jgi:hypothetical protein
MMIAKKMAKESIPMAVQIKLIHIKQRATAGAAEEPDGKVVL